MHRLDGSTSLATPDTSRILERCKLSQVYERAGNFSEATAVLGNLWKGVGLKPDLSGLPLHVAAEVLLRVGTLTGWLGGDCKQPNGNQSAESIIKEALSLYDSLRLTPKAAEARAELAVCCWRRRQNDLARDLLMSALGMVGDDDNLKAWTVMRLAGVEAAAGRADQGLALLDSSRELFKAVNDFSLTAKMYGSLVASLLLLIESIPNPNNSASFEQHIDRVFVECEGARIFYEQAGSTSGIAETMNSLGYAYFLKGRFDKALEHLDAAYETFASLGSRSMLAHVDETRARVFLAQDNPREAELYALASVTAMEAGGEQWNLPAALITRGRALARLNRTIEAIACFDRALKCAEQAGNLEAVKQAKAARLEEIGGRKPDDKSYDRDASCEPKVLPFRNKRMPLNPIIITVPDSTLVGKDILKGDKLELTPIQDFKDGDVALIESPDGCLLAMVYHEEGDTIRLEWSYDIIEPRRYKKDRYNILGVLTSLK